MVKKTGFLSFIFLILFSVSLQALDIYWNGEIFNTYSSDDLNLLSGGEYNEESGSVSIPLWHITPLSERITEFHLVNENNRIEFSGEKTDEVFSSLILTRDNEGDWFIYYNKQIFAIPDEIFLKGKSLPLTDRLIWIPPEMDWLIPELTLFSNTHKLPVQIEIVELIPESLEQRYLNKERVPDMIIMSVFDLAVYKNKFYSHSVNTNTLNEINPLFLNSINLQTADSQETGNGKSLISIPLFFSVYGTFTLKNNPQTIINDNKTAVLAGDIYNPLLTLLPSGYPSDLTPGEFNPRKTIEVIQSRIKTEAFLLTKDPEPFLKFNKTQSILIESHKVKDKESLTPFIPLWYPIICPYFLAFPSSTLNSPTEKTENQIKTDDFLIRFLAGFQVQSRTEINSGFFPTNNDVLELISETNPIAAQTLSSLAVNRGKIMEPAQSLFEFSESYKRLVGIIVNNQADEEDINKLYNELLNNLP